MPPSIKKNISCNIKSTLLNNFHYNDINDFWDNNKRYLFELCDKSPPKKLIE